MLTLGRTLRTVVRACALISLSTAIALSTASASAVDRSPNQTPTIVATGNLTLTTSPGILPAWGAADIKLTAIAPTTLTELTSSAAQRIQLPVVAKTGSANALSGGFRFTNTKTREVVNCFVPTIDTKARVLDCVTVGAGQVWQTNKIFFEISKIRSWTAFNANGQRTSLLTGIEFKIPDDVTADFFNDKLSTTVFSTSVTIATGTLDVTRRITN